jgi:hypothetical protein
MNSAMSVFEYADTHDHFIEKISRWTQVFEIRKKKHYLMLAAVAESLCHCCTVHIVLLRPATAFNSVPIQYQGL